MSGTGATAIFKVQGLDDGTIGGYVAARDLEPRDSYAPILTKLTGGGGKAYTTADTDGHHAFSGTFNEAATWTATIKRGDATVTSKKGDGTSFAIDLDTDATGDGAYTYKVTATDAWANGPTSASGSFTIDDVAPKLTNVSPNADTMKWVSPNGDLAKESVAWAATTTEAGSIGLKIVNADGATVRSTRVTVKSGTIDVSWDGRTSGGSPVPDGTYEARLTPRDAAGNDGPTIKRPVLVDTTLGDVDASKALFYPQDADRLAATTTLRFKLTKPATVTWTVQDEAGATVLTLLDGEALPAGPVTRVVDGKLPDGTYLPRGTYRSVVAVAGDGPVPILQYRTFKMRAFDPSASDATPGRGQRITVKATSAETLSTTPRVYVYQPGKATWSVAMTKVSTGKYQASLTLKTGGGRGEVRLQVKARDVDGRSQSSNLYLPLH